MAPSLQRSLLALVLVPVVGLTGAVALAVDASRGISRAADTAAAQVRAAALLDTVRGSIAQEVVPVLGQAVLADPATAAAAGLDASGLAGIADLAGPAIAQQLGAVQAATDTAVDATAGTAAAAGAAAAAAEVAQLRASAATGGDTTVLFTRYGEIVADLTGQVADHLDAARDESLDGPGARAVNDLDRAQEAATFASLQVPLLLGSVSVPEAGRDEARAAFLQAWGGYRAADADLTAHAGPSAVAAWRSATGSEAAVQVDTLLDAAATGTGTATSTASPGVALALPQFLALTTANTSRDAALRAAVDTIGDQAVAATDLPAQRAAAELRALLLIALVLLVVTAGVMGLVHRFIARPLRHLAQQAEAVRDGELDAGLLDVADGGPREVRSVARGLSATVASLRRVQAQAQAVADGDLDAEVVQEPLAGSLGAVVHASITQMISAIHERERLQISLAHQASHDALTELPNRAQASVLIERAVHRARRNGQHVGLLFVDLDHFKQVNDTLGHAAGDELLRVVSARMEETVRGGDAVCRLGGDEFVVLVEPAEDHHQLVELGQRLITAICAPVRIGDRVARVGASIGVAVSGAGTHGTPAHGADTTAERLLQEADAAAYRAKAAGRGVVEVFDDELRHELSVQAQTEEALRQALLGNELVLHYQPVLDLLTGRTASVEALVRWNRPGHGLVPPDAFIPAAERSDLICDLGRWALAAALTQLTQWDAAATAAAAGAGGPEGELAGLGVAVNISGRHLASRYLLDDVAAALATSGIDPVRLTLEITETVLVDVPSALDQLRALRELGVKIAIDDFGTGYTSIGQLPNLPVDILKIDRSFVSSPGAGHADLVRLVISAAHSFDLGVVAEGIEENDQLHRLVADSCDSGQGFLFARPTAPAELTIPRTCPATEDSST
ncbi:diguanylate cyclase (GGDEF)-like protein [Kineococcus radiotolerans]|uniref:Diguanylate cyclase (GGDEF)-like protein n=1 Tax=Kineococcus radiotolerans TaxID=131568 RepID=A0A7W4TR99_KINRA|nr:EAL domain-containing protein [Kineococcus radiotolerans]MBB2903490.1 diguanylate cyclase (GGDEF)-like protein [Kineococcus radiotolerans]